MKIKQTKAKLLPPVGEVLPLRQSPQVTLSCFQGFVDI